MADRVHNFAGTPPPLNPQQKKHPEAFVVQIPKDQIYRYPQHPSGDPSRFPNSRPRRGSLCCRCLCCTISFLIIFIIISAIIAATFYLVIKPKVPKYSVDRIAISGFNNFSANSGSISPSIFVSIRAVNPNDKIRILYQSGGDVAVRYTDVDLCDGEIPAILQPVNNVTVFAVLLKGSGLALSNAVKTALVRDESERKIPLVVKVSAPVKLQIGFFKTWRFRVKLSCELTVNNLTAKSRIVSGDCGVGRKLW